MNYQNSPIYQIMPPIPADAQPYYFIALAIFAVWFFVGIHWKMHVVQHGFPPRYVFWLREGTKRLLARLSHHTQIYGERNDP